MKQNQKWSDDGFAVVDTPVIEIKQPVHLSLCTIVINLFGRCTIYQGKKKLRDISFREYLKIRKDVKAVYIEVSDKQFQQMEVGTNER